MRQAGEGAERSDPNEDEEKDGEDGDDPGWTGGGGPEVTPIAAVGGGEPVILVDDDEEEPLCNVLIRIHGSIDFGERKTHDNDLTAEEGWVERGDCARCCAVVAWKTEEEHDSNGPKEDCDGCGYGCNFGCVCEQATGLGSICREIGQIRPPEPQNSDIDLLCALNNAGSEDP